MQVNDSLTNAIALRSFAHPPGIFFDALDIVRIGIESRTMLKGLSNRVPAPNALTF
ncbi:MAG: hypothetical protein AB7F88_11380 [Pyrinomonadaceae bacterium]